MMRQREPACPFCAQSLPAEDTVIVHPPAHMKPFVVNGHLYGWAWKDDPALIIQTLALPALGHA
jgi:hypothetical protein